MRAAVGLVVVVAGCRFGFEAQPTTGDGETTDGRSSDGVGPGDDGSNAVDSSGDPAPVLSFAFDEPNGTGTVTSTGTLGLAPVAAAGQQGVPGRTDSAIRFASPTDGIEIADVAGLDGLTQLTIEAWVYYDALSADYSTFVKKNGAYIMRTCDVMGCGAGMNKYVSGHVWDSDNILRSVDAVVVPPLATWTHVAFTYDGSVDPRVLRTFWNGVAVNATSYSGGTGATFDNVAPLTIGRAVAGENFAGRLDELRIWDFVRKDEGICVTAGRTWTGSACQ